MDRVLLKAKHAAKPFNGFGRIAVGHSRNNGTILRHAASLPEKAQPLSGGLTGRGESEGGGGARRLTAAPPDVARQHARRPIADGDSGGRKRGIACRATQLRRGPRVQSSAPGARAAGRAEAESTAADDGASMSRLPALITGPLDSISDPENE
jgi:hypothetical protein